MKPMRCETMHVPPGHVHDAWCRGEDSTHDADCLGHSECSCALPRFKARVAKLLRRIEWGDQGHCPVDFDDGECGASFYSKDQHNHRPDCPLAALLKECEE